MGIAIESARRETTGWKVYPLAVYYLIANNIALTAVLVGVIQIALAYAIHAQVGVDQGNRSILAGFLAVWGVSLIVIGLLVYGAFWANKLYGQKVLDGDA